jgi:outer membrane receptor protein involved in Fe transport
MRVILPKGESMKRLSRVGLAVSAVCAMGLATQAEAQRTTALEEIVVTARKTEETLQDAPVAVSAFGEEDILDRQIQTVDDVARFTPGFVFSKAFGRDTERPVIRGQSNVLAGVQFGVESGAAYFIDGVYYPGDIQSLDLSDLQRVEVIRGPQSALYGRNTYSGAVNFVTRSPSDSFGGKARASVANEEQDYLLRLEGPLLGETLRGSVSLKYNKFDGQWTNEVTQQTIGDEETKAGSVVLEWTPNEDVRVKLRGTYNEDRDGTRAFWFQDPSFNNCYPGTRSLGVFTAMGSNNFNQYFCGELQVRPIYVNDGTTVGTAVPTPAIPNAPGLFTYRFGPATIPYVRPYSAQPGVAFSGVNRDRSLVTGIFDWDIFGSGYNLILDTGFRSDNVLLGSDSDFSSVNMFIFDLAPPATEAFGANTSAQKTDDYSVEFRFSSPLDRDFRWMVGGFYYEQEKRTTDIDFDNKEFDGPLSSIQDLYNKAIFGLVEFRFAEDWSLTAEGRYTDETKAIHEFSTSGATLGNLTYKNKDSWDNFTPRLTLAWQATPDVNIYAVYAEGVKPGGFNGATGELVGSARYEQEESKNYELGLKSFLFNGRVVFNVAGFFIDSKDVQLTTPLQLPNSSNITSLATNQGQGEVKGVEVEARWAATDYLTLGLTYELADASFTEGFDDFQWTLTSGGGIYNPNDPDNALRNPNGEGDGSIKGKQYPMTSKNQASFTADWRSPLGSSRWEFFANADVTYEDKKPVQVHNEAFVPAATIVGARFGVSNDNWSVSVFGRNLTDEDAPQIATRWFQWPLANLGSPVNVPGAPSSILNTPVSTAGLVPAGSIVSTNFPRGFFGSFRRERQVGVEVSYSF